MVHPQAPPGWGAQVAPARQTYSGRHSQVLKSGSMAQSWPEHPLTTHGSTARAERVRTEAPPRDSARSVMQAAAQARLSDRSRRMSASTLPRLAAACGGTTRVSGR